MSSNSNVLTLNNFFHNNKWRHKKSKESDPKVGIHPRNVNLRISCPPHERLEEWSNGKFYKRQVSKKNYI